jgi:hypothetical protein
MRYMYVLYITELYILYVCFIYNRVITQLVLYVCFIYNRVITELYCYMYVLLYIQSYNTVCMLRTYNTVICTYKTVITQYMYVYM